MSTQLPADFAIPWALTVSNWKPCRFSKDVKLSTELVLEEPTEAKTSGYSSFSI